MIRVVVRIVVRCVAIIALTLLLAQAWSHYADAPALMQHMPGHMRIDSAAPVYARYRPIELDVEWGHVVQGVAVMACGLVVCWLAFRIRAVPTFLALVLAVLSVASINTSVASIRGGWHALDRPFARPGLEYYQDVPRVRDDPIAFARNYAAINRELCLHPGTHPPGGVLVLWAGSKVFDDSVTTAASVAITITSLAIIPAWWLAQLLGGRPLTRRIVPICAAAPGLVQFGATSMDGVFTTAILAALACGVWAIRRCSLWRAVVAGAMLWVAAFLTFTAICVPLVLLLATLVSRPRLMRFASFVLIGIAFIAVQAVVQWSTGYDFIATAEAAMQRDHRAMGTTGYETTEKYFALSVNNLAAFAFGSGVALTATALLAVPICAWRWRSYANRFALGAWVAILAMSFATLFTLETERVWMAMTPVLAICAGLFVRDRVSLALLVALLATQAILVEINLFTYW